jgi:hypothetical protein
MRDSDGRAVSGPAWCVRANLFYVAQQCGSFLIENGVRVCSTPGGVYSVDRNGGDRHTESVEHAET